MKTVRSKSSPEKSVPKTEKITTSSTAEYFSKNLQQVGFSSSTKAVLTTLKEAVDNSLDACEEAKILPEIWVKIEKKGAGTLKNTDQILIQVMDNGPGIDPENVPKVFGEYLASSKFGKGRCSRGQQGIGISAATTWAQLTSATGAKVITKTQAMKKAFSCLVEVDIKHNRGVLKNKEMMDPSKVFDLKHGTFVEFVMDGRIQINGEAGLLSYLNGTALVNPHLTLHMHLPDLPPETLHAVSKELPEIPKAVEPHPHTMKLGEFIAHSHLYGKVKVRTWLKTAFSRIHDSTLKDLVNEGMRAALLEKNLDALDEAGFKELFITLQKLSLQAPSTSSVLSIGEAGFSKSIQRIGDVDFFAVISRKPAICDFKPVQVEVAIARLKIKNSQDADASVQVIRFANRVPLQFDKASCAIVHSIESVNWRSYGLNQPRGGLPQGPYIIAVSIVSPFIKFKNASKETIDGSDELVDEIRKALIQAGQKLSKYIRAEEKAFELEQKVRHIEQFGPILVDGLVRMLNAPAEARRRAEQGLAKILGRDAKTTQEELSDAQIRLNQQNQKEKEKKKGAELA